jgi:hypothetical protein
MVLRALEQLPEIVVWHLDLVCCADREYEPIQSVPVLGMSSDEVDCLADEHNCVVLVGERLQEHRILQQPE